MRKELKDMIDRKMAAIGVPSWRVARWAPALADACFKFDITSDLEVSHFIAQLAHESNMYRATSESLNYSVTALRRLWKHRFTSEQAAKYGRSVHHKADQRMIANLAYGNRLGNEAYPSDDGWTYKGRGLIQVTGKTNYAMISKLLDAPWLMRFPQVLEYDVFAAMSAAAWWSNNKRVVSAARSDDVRKLTRAINGGYNGLKHRENLTKLTRAA